MGFKFDIMIKYDQILLNGVVYNQQNIDELFCADEAKDSWQNSIYYFLQNWFDDSDSILAQTSGSTGKPKDIRLAKQAMINSAKMTNEFFALDHSKTALLCLPASYIAGKMMIVRAITGNFNLITVEPNANPFENLNTEIDFTAITPYQLFHSAESLKTQTVRKIIVGGAPVTAKLEKLTDAIPSEMFETYGMTETSSHIALRRFNGSDKTDCFSILKGIRIRKDERDCLVLNAPLITEEDIITNDIVELINENSFRWLGRYDSIINSGGIKVHPEQIEKKLEGLIHQNYFISSMPDDLLENKIILIIESKKYSKKRETALIELIKSSLSKYQIPKQIYYLPNFIYSESNKLLKNKTLEIALKP